MSVCMQFLSYIIVRTYELPVVFWSIYFWELLYVRNAFRHRPHDPRTPSDRLDIGGQMDSVLPALKIFIPWVNWVR